MNNWSVVNNNYFIEYIYYIILSSDIEYIYIFIYYLISNTVNISLVTDRLSFITIRYAADSLS